MDMDEVLLETEEKMSSAVEHLNREFHGIRTGRASTGLVEHIKVDYYGTQTELRQLANISVPQATLIAIKPFDPSSLKAIEKAIQTSDIGITPNSDGNVIRLSVPALSTERRQQISQQIKKMAESAKVAIRNVRRDGNKELEKLQKNSEITEDDLHDGKENIQEFTKKHEQKVDELLEAKTKEVLET